MQVSRRCYAVTGLGYSPPFCVNAGIVAGDEITLIIDTGGNLLAAQTIHGYARVVRANNRLQVVNTEKHFDHIGGNGFFRGLGIDVWGHAGIARTDAEFAAEIAEFNESIPSVARRLAGEARAFFHGTELCNPNRAIHGDMVFELGNCDAHVLLTPGHTPTNLSLWIPEDRVLYSGDCLIREYIPNLDAGSAGDWAVWLESLAHIEALRPEVVVAGHGPPARGSEVQACIERVRSVLQDAIARGFSPTGSY